MKRYLVTRHGSNAANQHLTQKMDVCIVAANNATEAVSRASERINCYVNQHLSAIHVNSASSRTWAIEHAPGMTRADDGSVWPQRYTWEPSEAWEKWHDSESERGAE